ncbi:hypothetical protein EUGRSUZ_C03016 [Eucalyptus grandis]|uniref:Uncharacterized protein n=2 Tax=Eucalyptus grandis TaxID=71139 RepID=A0ACC3LHU1_EUCGR|nr:hypothetical protein EUGRSUZ_C03016 [Eucalyptus grandis]
MYDDIASNEENPRPGIVINSPDGDDVYEDDVYEGVPKVFTNYFSGGRINWRDVNVNNFFSVILGNKIALTGGRGRTLTSSFLYADDLTDVFEKKHVSGTYNSLYFWGLLPEGLNVYATTAANAEESSWGTYRLGEYPSPHVEYETCLGDLYSVAWMEDSLSPHLQSVSLPNIKWICPTAPTCPMALLGRFPCTAWLMFERFQKIVQMTGKA